MRKYHTPVRNITTIKSHFSSILASGFWLPDILDPILGELPNHKLQNSPIFLKNGLFLLMGQALELAELIVVTYLASQWTKQNITVKNMQGFDMRLGNP